MIAMHMYPDGLSYVQDGWADHQELLVAAIRDLTPEQLALRTAPHQWAIWQLAGHIAGTRAYWFHDVLGQGDRAVRDMFRVEQSTVPGVSLEDAGWEDDESRPRTASELVDALERSWSLIDDCLRRWTPDDLDISVERRSRTRSRGWVMWHVLEHDVHHGGEISQILGSHGLAPLDV
jgi:uncharacterized damage-inducible protein DinB